MILRVAWDERGRQAARERGQMDAAFSSESEARKAALVNMWRKRVNAVLQRRATQDIERIESSAGLAAALEGLGVSEQRRVIAEQFRIRRVLDRRKDLPSQTVGGKSQPVPALVALLETVIAGDVPLDQLESAVSDRAVMRFEGALPRTALGVSLQDAQVVAERMAVDAHVAAEERKAREKARNRAKKARNREKKARKRRRDEERGREIVEEEERGGKENVGQKKPRRRRTRKGLATRVTSQ